MRAKLTERVANERFGAMGLKGDNKIDAYNSAAAFIANQNKSSEDKAYLVSTMANIVRDSVDTNPVAIEAERRIDTAKKTAVGAMEKLQPRGDAMEKEVDAKGKHPQAVTTYATGKTVDATKPDVSEKIDKFGKQIKNKPMLGPKSGINDKP